MSRTLTSPTSTWCCHTTPPDSTTTRTTLPRKHGPHGKPPPAGTPAGPTSSQSSGSPKFERSEQQRQRVAIGGLRSGVTRGRWHSPRLQGRKSVLAVLDSECDQER